MENQKQQQTEQQYAVVQAVHNGRWYVRPGFAGCNTRVNNGGGYASAAEAQAAHQRYVGRSAAKAVRS